MTDEQQPPGQPGDTGPGEYEVIYTRLLDGPDFQLLAHSSRLLLFILKLSLGPLGIRVVRGGSAAFTDTTGLPLDQVNTARAELVAREWLEVESPVWWLVRGFEFKPELNWRNPRHRVYVAKVVKGLPSLQIRSRFVTKYAHWFSPSDSLTDSPYRSLGHGLRVATVPPNMEPSEANGMAMGIRGRSRSRSRGVVVVDVDVTAAAGGVEPGAGQGPGEGEGGLMPAADHPVVELLVGVLTPDAWELVAGWVRGHPRPNAFLALVRSVGPGGTQERSGVSWAHIAQALAEYAGSGSAGPPSFVTLDAFVRRVLNRRPGQPASGENEFGALLKQLKQREGE